MTSSQPALRVSGLAKSFIVHAQDGLSLPVLRGVSLAVSPGGMAEMSITAKVLHLGVPVVSAFHVVRIFLVIGFSEMVFRKIFRRQEKPG